MIYQIIERPCWREFCETVSKTPEGKLAALEIVSLSLGDQLEGGQLSFAGISYDPTDDVFYLAFDHGLRSHFEHTIAAAQHLYVELDSQGLSKLIVVERDGSKQFVHLRDPLRLPAGSPTS